MTTACSQRWSYVTPTRRIPRTATPSPSTSMSSFILTMYASRADGEASASTSKRLCNSPVASMAEHLPIYYWRIRRFCAFPPLSVDLRLQVCRQSQLAIVNRRELLTDCGIKLKLQVDAGEAYRARYHSLWFLRVENLDATKESLLCGAW